MNSTVRVVGLVQAKNEWPLLALSISHALMHHVDEVYVLNHSSTDGSFEGLQHLQELWKDRIHVLNFNDEPFWQEASTNALIVVSQDASPDWIYVFDSDEFILTHGNKPLKEIMDYLDHKYAVVRYEVQNWISTDDFDETHLDNYRLLRYRSEPNMFTVMHPDIYADEIRNGNWSFYDLPFPSKVIFRNNTASWLAAGAHSLKSPTGVSTLDICSDKLRVAHIPYLIRKRLEQKARQGQLHIQHRLPNCHGWQNQMLYWLSQDNKLDQFWESHTISHHNDSNNGTLPSYVIDDSFVRALEPVLCLLEDGLDSRTLRRTGELDLSSRKSDDTQIPFRTAVHLTRKCQLIADSLRQERDAIVAERNAIVAERDAIVTERDAIVAERDAIATERNAIVTERHAIAAERDAILNSRIWRYTRFLRVIRGYLSRTSGKKVQLTQ